LRAEVRPVGSEELAAFFACEGTAFGFRYDEDEASRMAAGLEPGRSLAAFAGDSIVATSGSYGLQLTVPGPSLVGAGGIAFVGVLPTHRRRGLLTQMMRRLLDDIRTWGEPVALLTASEGGIYGRFGFGPATVTATYELRRLAPNSWRSSPQIPGEVSLLDAAEAAKSLPEVFECLRRGRNGDVGRPAPWWDDLLRDDERRRGGVNALFVAGHREPDGRYDGYVMYRLVRRSEGPACVRVQELCATNVAAESALWRYVCDLDLSDRLELSHRPLDESLRWLLRDTRLLRLTGAGDHLWVRLLDLPRALAARAYRQEASMVLEVTDRFCPWNEGTWRLSTGSVPATVGRADGVEPDLVFDVSDLGAGYLGGSPFVSMARAGRVVEVSSGAAERADAVFGTSPLPFCATDF
jgi:predicted acetyltransferase